MGSEITYWTEMLSPRWVLRVQVFWTVYSVVSSAVSARGRRRVRRGRKVRRMIVVLSLAICGSSERIRRDQWRIEAISREGPLFKD